MKKRKGIRKFHYSELVTQIVCFHLVGHTKAPELHGHQSSIAVRSWIFYVNSHKSIIIIIIILYQLQAATKPHKVSQYDQISAQISQYAREHVSTIKVCVTVRITLIFY